MTTIFWLGSWITTLGTFVVGLTAICFVVIIIPSMIYAWWFDKGIARMKKELEERQARMGGPVDLDEALKRLKTNLNVEEGESRGLRIYRD